MPESIIHRLSKPVSWGVEPFYFPDKSRRRRVIVAVLGALFVLGVVVSVLELESSTSGALSLPSLWIFEDGSLQYYTPGTTMMASSPIVDNNSSSYVRMLDVRPVIGHLHCAMRVSDVLVYTNDSNTF